MPLILIAVVLVPVLALVLMFVTSGCETTRPSLFVVVLLLVFQLGFLCLWLRWGACAGTWKCEALVHLVSFPSAHKRVGKFTSAHARAGTIACVCVCVCVLIICLSASTCSFSEAKTVLTKTVSP